jgi:hypothetical protein
MQLTLNEQWGVELTPSGVRFEDNTPEDVVIDVWKWGYFVEKYGGKAKRSAREHYEKRWGFHKAIVVEAKIITDLGFEVTERIALDDADPIPSTDKLKKVFTALQERWKVAIETGNVEYLKAAADALRPMVEEWHQINEFLSKEGGAK